MKVNYNSVELDVSVTNIDVLEAIDGINADIESFKSCKTIQDTIDCIKIVETKVKTIVENGGADFSTVFPKRDYIDYLKFIQIFAEAFNKTDFKSELADITL